MYLNVLLAQTLTFLLVYLFPFFLYLFFYFLLFHSIRAHNYCMYVCMNYENTGCVLQLLAVHACKWIRFTMIQLAVRVGSTFIREDLFRVGVD